MGPPGELVFEGRQHLGGVDLPPLTAQAVEDVVLFVLEGPLASAHEVVGGLGEGRVARRGGDGRDVLRTEHFDAQHVGHDAPAETGE